MAAIALLGTILVGIVLAKARHTHQLALTQRQEAAVRAADELITQWWTSPEGVPIDERGRTGTDGSWMWKTRLVENEVVEQLGARVVRVELHESEEDDGTKAPAGEALVAVELVLPPAEEQQQETDSPASGLYGTPEANLRQTPGQGGGRG